MLATWGDGVKCPCVHCEAMLTYETVEADRIVPGGSYRRDNIQPACRACNLARSDDGDLTKDEIAARVQKMEAAR
jgi:5-methylcytosine-specific restriction endonuclease McrA